MKKLDLSLYLVTDSRLPWSECLRAVRAAVLGGVTIVQLREKDRSKDEVMHRAQDLLEILSPLGIPLIIDDHVDIAKAVGAQGVHLGKKDESVSLARAALGPKAIIGLSIESLRDFEKSEFEFCDYVSASPVFPTQNKSDAAPPMGLKAVRTLREICPIPLVAIGGITTQNARELSEIGIDGICSVSTLLFNPQPQGSAFGLKTIFEKNRKRSYE